MRLTQLKLVGFKSFVDAVTIPLQSQLIAVVGPNGCGKSNVIDAVRWVMGESQAKQLRGEAMTDVIFKGSGLRKPIGQASVELVFDNRMGKLSGAYASYQEIAVKRVVNRHGESTYFLNGTACRRRDITELFLGTGAGARGYSVIGQDTISRLIESRPEALRGYLEEAAGVSKYKERRVETMMRLTQTREHLARVADILMELTGQLSRLEHQAQTAKLYLQYQQEVKSHRFTIHALKWHALHNEQQICHQAHQEANCKRDAHEAQRAFYLNKREILQSALDQLAITNHDTQQQAYQNKTEITRLELSIEHQAQKKAQWKEDEQKIIEALQLIDTQLQQDTLLLQRTIEDLQRLQQEEKSLQENIQLAQTATEDFEKKVLESDATLQKIHFDLNKTTNQRQLETQSLNHLIERQKQLTVQSERQRQALAGIDEKKLAEDVFLAQKQHRDCEQAYQLYFTTHQHLAEAADKAKQTRLKLEQQLQRLNDEIQSIHEEHAALKMAQNVALEMNQDISQLDSATRLFLHIQVDDLWRPMVECILGESLQAMLVEQVENIFPILPQLSGQSALFVAPALCTENNAYPRLIDKVKGVIPSWSVALDQIYTADDLTEALTWLSTLSLQQSVITPDGYWLSQGWVRVFNLTPQDTSGLLTRQHALEKLSALLQEKSAARQKLIQEREQWHEKLTALQQEQSTTHKNMVEAAETLRVAQLAYEQKRQAEAHMHSQKHQWQQALEESVLGLELVLQSMKETETKLQALDEQHAIKVQKQADFATTKAMLVKQRQEATSHLQSLRATSQSMQIKASQLATHAENLQTQLERGKEEQARNLQRKMHLQAQAEDQQMPLKDIQVALEEKLLRHQQLESMLATERHQLEKLQQDLQEINQLCKYEEQQAKDLQRQIQQLDVKEHTLAARKMSQRDALNELDEAWEAKLTSQPLTSTLAETEDLLSRSEAAIHALGPINLLAIEEYAVLGARKSHLDREASDLNEALSTLERAVAKMDEETAKRFKATFDEVNRAFQALFPRLFGGGRAALEMTSDNLLETGVLVMAQPPGKRNNTIYMLSGGEKAMTAVALVFAIFQLNPSPFCMLDEVDAPLDEANVRRFCEIVREMSHSVQFLLVTHNKVTMEIAEYLIGVTMREPGVSRIVSVDMQALDLV